MITLSYFILVMFFLLKYTLRIKLVDIFPSCKDKVKLNKNNIINKIISILNEGCLTDGIYEIIVSTIEFFMELMCFKVLNNILNVSLLLLE